MVENFYNLKNPSKKGPRGFLFAYDETGNLLFTKENMIVESGRKKMMAYGFDTDKSKITKVILGNSGELTTPTFKDIKDMGNHTINITDRIIDHVITNPDGHEYVDEANIVKKDIYENGNINKFEGLTIDHKTGDIVTDTNDIFIHRVSIKNGDAVDIEGYDNSCFDIVRDDSKLRAIIKIFVRKTNNDKEENNELSSSISREKISELALFMGDEMFSRVVFPPYYKSSTQSIVFNYYIYF